MRSFRSKLVAGTIAFGPFTAFPTYNPLEVHAEPVMRLAGRPYGFDAYGCPDDRRPSADDRRAIVSAHPGACAVFFMATMNAVDEVAYGWRRGSEGQHAPNSVFGEVRMTSLLCCTIEQCRLTEKFGLRSRAYLFERPVCYFADVCRCVQGRGGGQGRFARPPPSESGEDILRYCGCRTT